jgi:hypothetical protein
MAGITGLRRNDGQLVIGRSTPGTTPFLAGQRLRGGDGGDHRDPAATAVGLSPIDHASHDACLAGSWSRWGRIAASIQRAHSVK